MYKTSVEQLKNIPLFAFVAEEDLELIAEKLELEYHPTDSIIINEGESGDCLYLIKTGRVKVFATSQDTNQEIILSYLDSGDHFGEMSLISGEPRSASIKAITDIEAWSLNRTVFDQLIMNNPNITLTLTHLLTQRLKEANVARKESEEYYEQKFSPKGDLGEISVVQILKYAEDNSLSGNIILQNGDNLANFFYKKGQLLKLEFGEVDEDEALDIILEWETGSYQIKPLVFKPDSKKAIVDYEEGESESDLDLVSNYILEKFSEFVHFAGAKVTQRAINRSYHNFRPYFDIIDGIKIEIIPELRINLTKVNNWTEKHTLLLAVILRDVVEAIDRDVIGIMFWSPRSQSNKINSYLEEILFFDFYEQATDMIVA